MASALVGARKRKGTSVLGNLRDKLKKALVDVPKLIRAHVAPVHTNESRRLAKPGQMEQSTKKRTVLDLRRIKLRALLWREQAGEGGQPKPRLAICKTSEDDLEHLPEIRMAIVGAPADRPSAKAAEGVSIGIELAGRVGCVLWVQQVPFLDRQQKDEPIDQSQELPKVAIGGEIAGVQRRTKLRVRGVRKEPLPQNLERLLKAGAQPVACPRPVLPSLLPPHLQRACRGRGVGAAEARLLRDEPERGEVGVQILGEDPAEVGFDPRRPRETRVVARDP